MKKKEKSDNCYSIIHKKRLRKIFLLRRTIKRLDFDIIINRVVTRTFHNTFRSHCTQIFVRKYILRAQLDYRATSNSSVEETRSISRRKSGRKDGSIVVRSVPLTHRRRFLDKTIERYAHKTY